MSSPPTTLGKYQIIREIARSNDIVYEAYDPLMNRRVALKELAVPNGSTEQQKEERLKRFLREAKAAGSLAHPNIVTIYEVGEDAGRHYLVMEYLDGHTLRNELDAKGFLPEEDAIKVSESVLRALEYAHQNGVIHRDIKPENIQMLTDGRVKLTDFGIARLTFEPNLTMDGQVFGTPSYMSPEQVVGRDIDVRSDIFSVGVVLYETLAGQKPFPGDSVVAITYAITNKEPERPRQIKQALWQVIAKALDKSPQMRYSSSSEMLGALASAKHDAFNQTMMTQGAPPPVNPYLPQQSSNPFLPPYPGGSYQNAPQPPIQYPYNPYGPPIAPPNSNPYDPYGQASGQYGPSQQTYLPGGNNYPVPGPTYLPSMPSVPVYYPPQPRGPRMSAEQRSLAVKVVLVLLVVGIIFGSIALVLVNATGYPQAAPSSSSGGVSQPQGQGGQDGSDPGTSDSASDNSVGLNQNADVDRANSDAAGSLTDEPAANLVHYLHDIANFEDDANAYSKGGDEANAQKYLDQEAEDRLQVARILMESNRELARRNLYLARDEASPNSQTQDEIQEELAKVT